MYWPSWITWVFYLDYVTGCPGWGDVISTWIYMCLLHNQSSEECWHGIGEAVGSWERPLCLVVYQGTETSHCESGQRWVTVLSIVFPPPFRSPAQPRTRERERKWLFIDGSVGACTGTQWGGESVSCYNCLSWSWTIPQQQATCMNATEWLITSDTTKQWGGCKGPIRVESLMVLLLLHCNLLWSDFKVLHE